MELLTQILEDYMVVSIQLPNEIEQRLQYLSKKTGQSESFFISAAIRKHLDNLEDLYLSEEQKAEFKTDQSESIPIEEITKRYGL